MADRAGLVDMPEPVDVPKTRIYSTELLDVTDALRLSCWAAVASWTGVEEIGVYWRDISSFGKAGGGIRICDAVGPRAFGGGARASSEMGPTAS